MNVDEFVKSLFLVIFVCPTFRTSVGSTWLLNPPQESKRVGSLQEGAGQEEQQEEPEQILRGSVAYRLSTVMPLRPAPAHTAALPLGVRSQHRQTWTSPLAT